MVGQNRTILRDHYDPPLSPYDYTSPLSGMRSYIKNHKDDVLLTVDDLPAGSTVRLAVMDRFDGNVEPVRFHHGFGSPPTTIVGDSIATTPPASGSPRNSRSMTV
ncbi:MAG: hypothetical protein ACLUB5_00960 [Bifidobacterium dentium]